MGKLSISSREKNLTADSFALVPAYPIGKFGHVFGKQTDRFDITFEQLILHGIDYDSILNKKVIIDSIDIIKPHADIFRDKRVPRDLSIFPKLFQGAVSDIPMPINIGK